MAFSTGCSLVCSPFLFFLLVADMVGMLFIFLLFPMDDHGQKSDEQWQKDLTPEQYRVMRMKGTEAPFTGEYVHTKAEGIYKCAGCGAELFDSDAKFDSGTGWPSFTDMKNQENIELKPDTSHGMVRTEVLCKHCGAHLGHVFEDGPSETGKRYCINSCSLKLDESK